MTSQADALRELMSFFHAAGGETREERPAPAVPAASWRAIRGRMRPALRASGESAAFAAPASEP